MNAAPWLRLAAAVILTVAAAGGAAPAADAPFAFDATPGRLPKTVVPTQYTVELRPDLEARKIPGSVMVELEVREATDRFTLNAVAMTIDRAMLDGDAALSAAVTMNGDGQTATLTFPRAIAPGKHRLAMDFVATLNPFGRGLFFTDYPTDAGPKRMIGSHLEPADARRVFPCWDEPAFKASIALTAVLPKEFLAVSNTPVEAEEPVDARTKRVRFAATPHMSTYLFVLVAGELERIAQRVEGVEIGVVAQKGKAEQGRFALESAAKLLPYYNRYFGAAYPLPKLDLVALPGGFRGAMENWGGITFFEPLILYDPARSAETTRRYAFAVLAHEMAHQWFGNLVTMAWWDNLWLNEGFASWMENKATDAIHPDWRVWLAYADAKQSAMAQDARRSTHPIQQPVPDESTAMQAFDGITYRKGQAFIRMLEAYLGEEPFRQGIALYMQRHAMGSATTVDLWRALEEASGRPVAPMAARFTEQPGVPLVLAQSRCGDGRQHLTLTQERFTLNDPDAAALRWLVPVDLGPFGAKAPPTRVLLDGTAEIAAGRCDEAVKLNLGDVGYYRVFYDADSFAALGAAMPRLTPEDRVNLLADAWALAEAGRVDAGRFLSLLAAIPADDHRAVWETVIRALTRIDYLQRGRPERAAFQQAARRVLRPAFDRLGWDPRPGESADDGLLRPRLLRVLGELDDPATVAEANHRFDRFLAGPATLPADLRGPVAQVVGRHAGRARYDALARLARDATSTEERQRYTYALAAARDPDLAEATLAMTLAPEFPPHMAWGILSAVAYGGEQADRAWAFLQQNFDALAARQEPGFREGVAQDVLASKPDRGQVAAIEAFAPAHATPGARIASERATARILADIEQRQRLMPQVDAWAAAR